MNETLTETLRDILFTQSIDELKSFVYEQQIDLNQIIVHTYHPVALCCRHDLTKILPTVLELGGKVKGLNLVWYKKYLTDPMMLSLIESRIQEEEPEVWQQHLDKLDKWKIMNEYTKQVEENVHKNNPVECARCSELFIPEKDPLDPEQPLRKSQIQKLLLEKKQELFGKKEDEYYYRRSFFDYPDITPPNVCRFHYGKDVCKESGRGFFTSDTSCCSQECCKKSMYHPGCCVALYHVVTLPNRCKHCGIYEDIHEQQKCQHHTGQYFQRGWKCCKQTDFFHPGCEQHPTHIFDS